MKRTPRKAIPAVRTLAAAALSAGLFCATVPDAAAQSTAALSDDQLDDALATTLRKFGFSGKIESTLAARLGRPVDQKLADVGRNLFFDPLTGLHNDNSCAGCHAPNAAFGDTQSIAIGIQSNMIVGPGRKGPRNQRRSPSVLNVAFFPWLMWNARFGAPSENPFDNSRGFEFPPPEGTNAFPPNDPVVRHLLIAHAHMPVTELNESAGFTGTRGMIGSSFDQFDDGLGGVVPLPDQSGSRNGPIRQELVRRLNANDEYRRLFSTAFSEVRQGMPITMLMYARAIAEFEFTLVRADAPIDQFARGKRGAMTKEQKRGALLFFGKANCVACHAVTGTANEMFSDFRNHNAGIPQIAPRFGLRTGNTIFDGPGADEDFGLEQVTGNPADRYKFRTSPLRNVALQQAFFHNGAFTRLDDALRYHLDAVGSAPRYSPAAFGVAPDLDRMGPMANSLARIDPLLASPVRLSESEIQDLCRFLGEGLTDVRARGEDFSRLAPDKVPSKMHPMNFQKYKK